MLIDKAVKIKQITNENNTIPACLSKKDSVKNNMKLDSVNIRPIKDFFLIKNRQKKINIINKEITPIKPNPTKVCMN